jgi:hypothetical protein
MTVRYFVISVDSLITLLFVFAELELEQDDDVGDEDPGDGEAAGVAQLEGRHRRNGAVLQNLSSQHFDLKKDVSRYLNTMFHHTQVFKKLHIQTYYVKKSLKLKLSKTTGHPADVVFEKTL